MTAFEKQLVGEDAGGIKTFRYRYDYALLEKLRAVFASYMCHMKWADTYRLRVSLLKQYSFLKEYFNLQFPAACCGEVHY